MDEYGFQADSICSLDGCFWADVKREGRFETIKAELAQLRLPVHVNKHIRGLNRDRGFGVGATRC
eukprot:1896647-Prymnesium_polylepis.1